MDAGGLLFPSRCLGCGRVLVPPGVSVPVCSSCVGKLLSQRVNAFAVARCRMCGIELVSEQSVCTRCRDRAMQFDLHRSLFYYTGLARTLVNAFKFQRQVRLARLFADLLAESCQHADISAPLCPIPAHPWNRRRRGFSTADRLVGCMRKRAGMPVVRLLGRRISRQQKALGYSSRKANVEGMFTLRTPYPSRHMVRRLERVILVDDVFTTGATVSECARVLKEAGVKFVGVVTLAMEL